MLKFFLNVFFGNLPNNIFLLYNGSDIFCNELLLKDFLFLPQSIKNLLFQLFIKFRMLIFHKRSEPLIIDSVEKIIFVMNLRTE